MGVTVLATMSYEDIAFLIKELVVARANVDFTPFFTDTTLVFIDYLVNAVAIVLYLCVSS